MKLCKDCRFSAPHPVAEGKINALAVCTQPDVLVRRTRSSQFAVTGEGDPFEPRFCSTERIGKSGCGEAATLFEPRVPVEVA